MHRHKLWPKLFLVFSVVILGILLVNIWYVNLISLKKNARGTQKERSFFQMANSVPAVCLVNLSKNDSMNGISIIQNN
jgi:uncharacterized membrane protein